MSALDRKDLNKIALVSGITGLPLDDVVGLLSEKNQGVIARGVPNVSGIRYLDETINQPHRQGDQVESCWGHGMTHLIHGISCPYMRQMSWTDDKAHERKAIAYCTRIKPFDIAITYSREKSHCDDLILESFGITPTRIEFPEDIKKTLDSLSNRNITIATLGIIYDASRTFCERADDGFPCFCPLPKEI